jgi:hypothetical protein
MRRGSRRRIVVWLMVAMVVAGCSAGPPSSTLTTIDGTMTTLSGDVPIVAGIAMVRAGGGATALSLVEVDQNVFAGGISPVGGDGSFSVPLPDTATMDAFDLSPVSDFIGASLGLPCELDATDPSARVTEIGFIGLTAYPALFFLSLSGPGIAQSSTEPMTPPLALDAVPLVTWAYADRAVGVATPAAGCSAGDLSVDVDVSLRRGWNQLAWTFDPGPVTSVRLRDEPASPIYAYANFLGGTP